jgi:hypothetical protein
VSGSLGATLDPEFALSWSHGRVRSARAVATLRGNVDLGIEVAGGATCSLEQLPVGTWSAPPIRFFAGPIPVVVVPRTTLYVSADAQAAGAIGTRVRGRVTARAGLRYDGGVRPVGAFSQSLAAEPPATRTQATLDARLTPSVELLLYGQAGPRIDLGTGLQLDATPGGDPWWELSVPVELSAGLRLPGLDVPQRTVFSRLIPLARAGSPALAPPASAPATPRERARITWDTAADVDLHVWDSEGRHSSYRESGIPGVLLSKDDTNGFGPETLGEDAPAGRGFSYGLCYFDARGAGPTTVSARLTDPDGTARSTTTSLRAEGDSALIGSSPAGARFTPPPGWCEPRH